MLAVNSEALFYLATFVILIFQYLRELDSVQLDIYEIRALVIYL